MDNENLAFNTYQLESKKTAIYPRGIAIIYLALGLNDEAGEVAGKVKKLYRDNAGELTPEIIKAIAAEMSDVMWYLSQMATELGLPLSQIAQMNLDKISSRMERDEIHGSGDNR